MLLVILPMDLNVFFPAFLFSISLCISRSFFEVVGTLSFKYCGDGFDFHKYILFLFLQSFPFNCRRFKRCIPRLFSHSGPGFPLPPWS